MKPILTNMNVSLEGGKVYAITKFVLDGNHGLFKTCKHLFKIKFTDSTIVTALEDDPKLSYYGFNFISFPDISSSSHVDSVIVGQFLIYFVVSIYCFDSNSVFYVLFNLC